MSTTTTPDRVEGTNVVVLRAPTLQWALKRTLLGLAILFVTITAAASLLYASIEPDEELPQPAYSAPQGGGPAFTQEPAPSRPLGPAERKA